MSKTSELNSMITKPSKRLGEVEFWDLNLNTLKTKRNSPSKKKLLKKLDFD
jgi:hypothetical protein